MKRKICTAERVCDQNGWSLSEAFPFLNATRRETGVSPHFDGHSHDPRGRSIRQHSTG